MSTPRRERDNRRQAKFQNSEDYFKRLMEETPAGKVTPSDVSHVARQHRNRVNERRSADIMGMTRGAPQISFGAKTVKEGSRPYTFDKEKNFVDQKNPLDEVWELRQK